MGNQDLNPEEVQAFKQELADIKADMMRKELEEIKKERMRQELEDIRRERELSAAPKNSTAPARARRQELSLTTVLFAALSLLIAGYLISTLYTINVTAEIDSLLSSNGLPAAGSIVIITLAILLALFGTGMITIAKK